MRIEEAILFLAVVALSLALVVVVVAPILRQRRRAAQGAPEAAGGAAVVSLETVHVCPACHRHQSVDFRFCPFDGTPLGIRLPVGGEQDVAALAQDASGALLATSGGKICPSCSRRYRLDTTVCPRDGAPLVAVN